MICKSMNVTLYKSNALKKIPAGASTLFEGIFVLVNKTLKTAKNGNPFVRLELGDRFGRFSCNCFNDSPNYAVLNELNEGVIVRISGESDHYQDRFSPKLRSIRPITHVEAENAGVLDDLFETPPESEESLWADLQAGITAIAHAKLQATVAAAIEENEQAFRSAAAAISMHHAYRHGLLEHTVHMLRAAQALLPIYPQVDADLAIAGIILHDIGKIEEYTNAPGVGKTRAGQLQGHVVLGYRMVRKAALTQRLDADLTERLEHIILSHQGEISWGAAVMAATPEAVFVSMIDNLDAKMGMVQRTLRNATEGEVFSDFMPGLQAQLLLDPPQK
jgi:3'-5' exoribonuclease